MDTLHWYDKSISKRALFQPKECANGTLHSDIIATR